MSWSECCGCATKKSIMLQTATVVEVNNVSDTTKKSIMYGYSDDIGRQRLLE